jgi:hypothetical protein
LERPISKTSITKRAGGVAQGIGPELKPQYSKKKKKKKGPIARSLRGAKRVRTTDPGDFPPQARKRKLAQDRKKPQHHPFR